MLYRKPNTLCLALGHVHGGFPPPDLYPSVLNMFLSFSTEQLFFFACDARDKG